MKTALVLLVCAICATTCSVEAASSFYVSPSGNDANPGTFAAPFQTLARASAAVRTINQQMNSDVTVYLRGGVYALDAPWTLTQEDSGFNGFNVIYTAYTAENPIVSGGVQVRNWKLYNESLNIWVADTSDLFESTRQIYVDDVRMPRCYRGNGILGNVTITDTGYLTDATDLLEVADPSTIEFVYTGSGTSWTEARCGVESITALPKGAGTNITMKQPCFAIGRNRPGGQGFNVPTSMENAFEFCSSNGMWFHDEEQQLLFYIPADGGNVTSNTGVVVPTIEVLLEVVGTVGESSVDRVHNIQFQNIHFEHAGWTFPSSGFGYVDIQGGVMLLDPYATATNGTQTPANVRVEAGQQIVFDGCTFRHLGASGLAITNSSQFNLVTNCIFTDISAAGVQIGIINDHTETRPEFFHSYNNVTNCLFFDLPVEYRGNVVLFGGYLVSSEFSHNEISDAPYAAINLGWGWSRAPGYSSNNIVNYNKLFNYMRVLIDGGGVYTLGPQPTSEVGFNYLFSQHHLFGSLYHDEGSGNFWTHDNVVSNSPEWLHIWTGSIFDINVANCYTDQTFMTFAGTNCTLVNTTYVTNGDWPAGALEIMANAGVSSSMLHRKAKLLARSAKSPVAPRAPVNPEWSLSTASGFESYDRRGRWVDPKLFSTC